jgi:hypothetical protein
MDCLREDNIASPAPLAASATLPSSPEKIIVPYGTSPCRAADGIVEFGLWREQAASRKIVGPQQ